MISTRVRRAIVGCAALTLTAAMGAGVAPAALASVPHPTVRDTDGPVPAHGVPTGYVRDSAGTSLLVVVRNNGVQYLTRRHGASRWISRHVPGSSRSGLTTAHLALSPDGSHEFLLVLAGERLYLVEKKTGAANFPRITAATKIASAHTAEPFSLLPAITALPHNRVALLVRDAASLLRVSIARPGHVIHPFPIDNDEREPNAAIASGGIARDPQTGRIFAVAPVSDVGHPIVGWIWPAGGMPVFDDTIGLEQSSTHPDKAIFESVTAVTMLKGQGWVATTHSTNPQGPTDRAGVFLASCSFKKPSNSDQKRIMCSSEQRLPHTDRQASHLLLVADQQRDQLQAVFEQSGTGLMHEVRRSNGTWSSPTRVTKGSDDQPLFLVGTAGHGFRYLFERKG
jgi:hypothetical protein